MAIKLNEASVKAILPPTRGAITVWDTEIAGFGVRVFPEKTDRDGRRSVTRSFFLNYRHDGTERAAGRGCRSGPRRPMTGAGWRLRWYRVARGLVEVFCRAFWRVEIHGLDRVPVSGPYVIAPVTGSLRSGGKVIGSFVMSVQDDVGFTKLETRGAQARR